MRLTLARQRGDRNPCSALCRYRRVAVAWQGPFGPAIRIKGEKRYFWQFCLLGRRWFSVFRVLSLLIARFVCGGDVASDAFIVILGILFLGFIAWAGEWRERLRAALADKPLSP